MLICFIVAAVMINSVFTVASGYRKSIHEPTIQFVRNSFRGKQINLDRKLSCTIFGHVHRSMLQERKTHNILSTIFVTHNFKTFTVVD